MTVPPIRLKSCVLVVLCCFAFVHSVSAQRRWTVGASAECDFESIQEAVDASAVGDTVFVRLGLYGGFVVEKSLKIVGEVGESLSDRPLVLGNVEVKTISQSQSVLLTGITVFPDENRYGVLLVNCNGLIVLDDIKSGSMSLQDCDQVFMRDGGLNQFFPVEGSYTLTMVNSSLTTNNARIFARDSGGLAMFLRDSRIAMFGGVVDGRVGSSGGSLGPIGLLERSSVLWYGGVYDSCLVAGCPALFLGDADSTVVNAIDTMASLSRVMTPTSLQLDLFNPHRGYVLIGVSPLSSPVFAGTSAVWLDGSQWFPVFCDASGSSSLQVEFPLVEFPQRLGIPFVFQAGVLTEDFKLAYSNPVLVTI